MDKEHSEYMGVMRCLGVVESHGENFNTEWAPLLFFFNKLGPACLTGKGQKKQVGEKITQKSPGLDLSR